MKTFIRIGAAVAATVGLGLVLADDAKKPADDPALVRARAEVQMLDALYKNAVVAVTDLYDGPPAIKVAQRVFAAMEKGGHHSARLVDATGSPMKDANVPKSDFEKRAAEAIAGGQAYYEEVAGEGPDRRLQAATIVPAVHAKCASCHGVKEGDLLGFIRYDLPAPPDSTP